MVTGTTVVTLEIGMIKKKRKKWATNLAKGTVLKLEAVRRQLYIKPEMGNNYYSLPWLPWQG